MWHNIMKTHHLIILGQFHKFQRNWFTVTCSRNGDEELVTAKEYLADKSLLEPTNTVRNLKKIKYNRRENKLFALLFLPQLNRIEISQRKRKTFGKIKKKFKVSYRHFGTHFL